LEKNDLLRGEMALKRAATLDPTSAEPPLLLGYIRLRQNQITEALPFFRKANSLNASDTVSLCMVGYVYQRAGHTDQAIQCYAKALKMRPGDDLATKLLASVQ
jgi:Flp pilus assembly protein TadD